MLALFKTHASISRSILKNSDILDFQKDQNLKKVVAVEDSFYGFRELNSKLLERKVDLIFGIRLPVVQNSTDELSSKLVFFAKNNDGLRQIKKLYTKTHCSDSGLLILNELKKEEFSETKVAVPFYDSFVYQNIFNFALYEANLSRFDHFYFEEANDHPFDQMISAQLRKIADPQKIVKAKSIYYKNREDVTAFQFYKSVCSRSGGKPPNYGNPQLEHFCSAEFCIESYLENVAL
jgi:DNA polymerase III alpha subunit